MNIALILSGGIGTRIGESIPKQFIEINNKPLIVYTIEKFNKNNNIDYILVVCHKDWLNYMEELTKKYKLTKVKSIIPGGNSGLESVYNGIQAISKFAKDDAYILIHDGVRPFIDDEILNDNIVIAKDHDVAVCAVKLLETLAVSEDNLYSDTTVPRDNLYRVQTPQTFKLAILKSLYNNKEIINSTEPSTFSLYMKQGLPIYLSKGKEKNIKITYPEDIKYFKNFFN